MATDGVNISEDAEMAECDGDKVVTMMDVLQEQQDFEEDANAVLGASDDKNCTYSKGYIKRQALYACLTCCTEAKADPTKRAGVCLACSLNCHENHELIELYTKRNFRCDCGNPKFNSHPCQFTQEKTELNDENIYNQNFSGLYCTCHRPYPDPDSTIEDDMIQCIICEDWLHASHLEAVVPSSDQYSEMVCKGCMEKNEFLHDYSMFAVNVEVGDVDIITVNGENKSNNNSLCNGDMEKDKLVNGIDENKTESEPTVVAVNGDVEMNVEKEQIEDIEKSEDKVNNDEKSEKIDESVAEDKVKDDEENEKINESVALATNEETKHDDSNNVESTESKLEEKENFDIINDRKMDLDTENKEIIKKETCMDSTVTSNQVENDDAPTIPHESNVEKESAETNKISTEAPEVKLDSLEPTSEVETNQNNDTSADDQTVTAAVKVESIDDKLESIDAESQKNETQEESIQQSITGGGDGDKVPEKTIDANEKTEQQLLEDLSALTDDTPTSKDKENTSAELVESTEQTEDGKEKQDDQTNNGSEETTNKSEDSTKEKPVSGTENSTTNIEVPDTSQPEKDKKETTDDKSDSVMDAIDELLQTANEVNESETSKEKSSESTDSTESKDDTKNVESKQSIDVEMSTSESKFDKDVPEKVETNDNTSINNDTEDVEMSDATTEKETPVIESKVDEVPISDSENKDVINTEASEGSSKDEEKVKSDNESAEDTKQKPEVIDTTNESSKENETENELKTSDESESTIKIESSTEEGKESKLTENSKEHKRKLSTDLTEDTSPKKAKLECKRPKGAKRVHKGATFWPSNFRQKLCTCGECLSMYKDLKVLFLTDLEDTVFAYESLGKENVAGVTSQYEKGLQALSSLDRIQQINALTEYNKMRDKLLDFLKSFKDRKEIVKEEDIKAFFAGMKPRREPDGVYFCR